MYSIPKGRKERTVPLPESAAQALAAHMQAYPPEPVTLTEDGKPRTHELIFTSQRGGAIDRNRYNVTWRRARAAAGVPAGRENGFHVLRHTFASDALAGGVNIRALQEYLGHRSASVTLDVYGHLLRGADDQLRAAIDTAARVSGWRVPDVSPAAR